VSFNLRYHVIQGSARLGDINGDGKVDMQDIKTMLNVSLPPKPTNFLSTHTHARTQKQTDREISQTDKQTDKQKESLEQY
jgi:hypothetical protein